MRGRRDPSPGPRAQIRLFATACRRPLWRQDLWRRLQVGRCRRHSTRQTVALTSTPGRLSQNGGARQRAGEKALVADRPPGYGLLGHRGADPNVFFWTVGRLEGGAGWIQLVVGAGAPGCKVGSNLLSGPQVGSNLQAVRGRRVARLDPTCCQDRKLDPTCKPGAEGAGIRHRGPAGADPGYFATACRRPLWRQDLWRRLSGRARVPAPAVRPGNCGACLDAGDDFGPRVVAAAQAPRQGCRRGPSGPATVALASTPETSLAPWFVAAGYRVEPSPARLASVARHWTPETTLGQGSWLWPDVEARVPAPAIRRATVVPKCDAGTLRRVRGSGGQPRLYGDSRFPDCPGAFPRFPPAAVGAVQRGFFPLPPGTGLQAATRRCSARIGPGPGATDRHQAPVRGQRLRPSDREAAPSATCSTDTSPTRPTVRAPRRSSSQWPRLGWRWPWRSPLPGARRGPRSCSWSRATTPPGGRG